jgi:hypothetical protein
MTTKTQTKSKTQTKLKTQAKKPAPSAKPKKPTANKRLAKKNRGSAIRKPVAAKSSGKKSLPSFRTGTKQALLIDLLKRKNGATLIEAMEVTGWQAHSVRGAISGTLKKKLGLTVTSKVVEGRGRVYQIGGHTCHDNPTA